MVAEYVDKDTNASDNADVTEGDLSALMLAWRTNYADVSAVRVYWFVSSVFFFLLFAVTFTLTRRARCANGSETSAENGP